MLSKISEKSGLTKNEVISLIALAGFFVVGITVKLFGAFEPAPPKYNYAGRDSLFISSLNSDKPTEDLKKNDSVPKPSKQKGSKTPKGSNLQEQSIDINSATAEQFEQLPGIGAKTAQKVVEYRTQHGRFNSIEEIQKVKGIGAKKFEQFKKFIFVGN